jgi:hypothetical protein
MPSSAETKVGAGCPSLSELLLDGDGQTETGGNVLQKIRN